MARLLLILIIVTQLGCASIFWQTVGSFIGGLAVEVVKDKMDEAKKEKPPEK
jgi:hypothetical protein